MSTAPATISWMDYVTLATAGVGAVLGIMNTWNAMNQQRVRIRVTPNFVMTLDRDPLGVSIEVINLSAFPVTVAEVGFMASNRGRMVVTNPSSYDGRSLPCRLEPRAAISIMFGPRDSGIPNVALGSAYARTACGRNIRGNSPAGRQFGKMMSELVARRKSP